MEIGSFIGLDLRNTGEFHNSEKNIARLNSARAGIYHACRIYGCNSIYIPYYLCPTVKEFLFKKAIKVQFYFINEKFEPVGLKPVNNSAVLLVNYFGIIPRDKMRKIASQYKNVILDNSAAFYTEPVEGCLNVYSPRKFFGVPDGCYVIGHNAGKFIQEYPVDSSSSTASFLMKSIEQGTSAVYKERMANEERIDRSDILNMSKLTRTLLGNINYSEIKKIRGKNFNIAHKLYKKINKLDLESLIDTDVIPMIYPLIIHDPDLDEKLRQKKIYVGRLWKSVLKEVVINKFESRLSRYLIPIPVDQRYSAKELSYVAEIIGKILND